MAGQLIPLPDMVAQVGKELSPTQRVQLWVDLMATCDDLLRAGLLHSVDDRKDLPDAYKHWYKQKMLDHDRMIAHMAERLCEATANAS